MWYYIVNQKVVGPVSLEEIINLINAGVIVKTTCLWQSGQVRQTAGQVPELVPFLQQEPLPRPEPVPRPAPQMASVPPKPVPRQIPRSQPVQTRQQPQTRTSRPKPTAQTEQPESLGGRIGAIFQVLFIIIIILCSLASFGGSLEHQSNYEKAISEFSRLGAYAQIDTYAFDNSETATMAYSSAIVALVIGCLSLGIGYLRKKYRIAIVSCIIPAVALGVYLCINSAEKVKFYAIEQSYCSLPYYVKVKEFHELINKSVAKEIAEHGIYGGHKYPEELLECARQTTEKNKELDEFNAQTMQMILNEGNEEEIEDRYLSSFKIFAEISRQFSDLYKASRIDE